VVVASLLNNKVNLRFHNIFSLVMVVAQVMTVSCIAQKNKGYYHEDLFALRPKIQENVDTAKQVNSMLKADFIPTYNVNRQVNLVLDSINRFNLTRRLIDGFTIQIYSGQNKEEAMNTKKKVSADLPELNAELEYNQPKFRVRIGSYISRLEAQKDLLHLKRYFPNAILVPEKIQVR
jgi:SPOR domain